MTTNLQTTTTTDTTTKPAEERSRPIPEAMLPSEDGLVAIDRMIARVANVMLETIAEIEDIDHPIERSISVTAFIEVMNEIAVRAKDVRRDAVKDAYEQGRSVSGWYGYAALGSQIGLSASRVRQILFDISTDKTGKQEIRDKELIDIRDVANARRAAIRMLRQGTDHHVIAKETGLPAADVHKIARALIEG